MGKRAYTPRLRPALTSQGPAAVPDGIVCLSLAGAVRLHVLTVLSLCGGNREATARVLDVSLRTCYRLLRDLDLLMGRL